MKNKMKNKEMIVTSTHEEFMISRREFFKWMLGMDKIEYKMIKK